MRQLGRRRPSRCSRSHAPSFTCSAVYPGMDRLESAVMALVSPSTPDARAAALEALHAAYCRPEAPLPAAAAAASTAELQAQLTPMPPSRQPAAAPGSETPGSATGAPGSSSIPAAAPLETPVMVSPVVASESKRPDGGSHHHAHHHHHHHHRASVSATQRCLSCSAVSPKLLYLVDAGRGGGGADGGGPRATDVPQPPGEPAPAPEASPLGDREGGGAIPPRSALFLRRSSPLPWVSRGANQGPTPRVSCAGFWRRSFGRSSPSPRLRGPWVPQRWRPRPTRTGQPTYWQSPPPRGQGSSQGPRRMSDKPGHTSR